MSAKTFHLGFGSMYERIRRSCPVELDPHIFHASLIYGEQPREFLKSLSREYLDIGRRFDLPMIVTTPTWRANAERIGRSRCAGLPVNQNAATFSQELRSEYSDMSIRIEGCIGYRPEEAPGAEEAMRFHTPQIEALATSGVDGISAYTLPAADEAYGMAKRLSEIGLPYILSFVLTPRATLLDGTPAADVFQRIDALASPPEAYLANCIHASAYEAVYAAMLSEAPEQAKRLQGLIANTSARTPEELDGLEEIDSEAPEDFGRAVWALRQKTDAWFLGGCCGSSTAHIEELAKRAAT